MTKKKKDSSGWGEIFAGVTDIFCMIIEIVFMFFKK